MSEELKYNAVVDLENTVFRFKGRYVHGEVIAKMFGLMDDKHSPSEASLSLPIPKEAIVYLDPAKGVDRTVYTVVEDGKVTATWNGDRSTFIVARDTPIVGDHDQPLSAGQEARDDGGRVIGVALEDSVLTGDGVHRVKIRLNNSLNAPPVEADEPTIINTNRCPKCDWPYAASAKEGCVPGNCSMREGR